MALSFTCESNFLSDASHTLFQMRVMLSFRRESHFPSHASHTFVQMRVTLSFRCESHVLTDASHTFLHMRVTLSFRCELHFRSDASRIFFFFFDASQTFFQMRVKLFESEEEAGVRVRRKLVWKWGGGWCESEEETGRSPVTYRLLFGLWKECRHVARWFVPVTQLKIADMIRSVQTHAREALQIMRVKHCILCKQSTIQHASKALHIVQVRQPCK